MSSTRISEAEPTDEQGARIEVRQKATNGDCEANRDRPMPTWSGRECADKVGAHRNLSAVGKNGGPVDGSGSCQTVAGPAALHPAMPASSTRSSG